MEWKLVSKQDVADALRTTLNWKAPRRDQIPNFWLKQLTATHKYMAVTFNKLTETGCLPEWLTAAVTFLTPKNENTENPNNYRPVSCLPTTYKLLTSIISRRKQTYMDDNNLLRKEQKGCCKGTKGCKDHLLLPKAIVQDCKRKKKI